MRPFDWTVWLAVGLTVLAFPFIAFVIEFMSVKGRIVRSEVLPGYRESAVGTTGGTLSFLDFWVVV